MNVKRFFARDIRQAIRMVREELGPDAVIMSNRRVDGGVEIMAATDYSESLFSQYQNQAAPAAPAQAAAPAAERRPAAIRHYQDQAAELDDEIPAAAPRRREPPAAGTAPAAARSPAASPAAAPAVTAAVLNEQDPLLMQVRNELKTMRTYLENQIAELSWSTLSNSAPLQAELVRRGVRYGLAHDIARELARPAPRDGDIDTAWTGCLARLAARIPLANDDMISHGGVIALVGPTGVGKTTTVAKLAARYALRHGVRRIALISTDDYRVGAHEQLRTYGRLLDIPVRNASTAEELQARLADFADKELVFIDTAGISQRDIRLSEQLALLRETSTRIKVYLVLAANAEVSSMEAAVGAFSKIDLDGCIVTKVDEAGTIGGVLSAVIRGGLPLTYFSDGQRVPEDLHLARAEKLINQGVTLMKQRNKLDEDEMIMTADGGAPGNAH